MQNTHDFMLTVTTVDEPLYAGKVRSVSVPATEGTMTVLAHHEPFVTLLSAGAVIYELESGERTEISIDRGVLEVSNNQATILV